LAALLNDAEAALQYFKQHAWAASQIDHRDRLKERLGDAYATAKELGDLVAAKRQTVTALKTELAELADDDASMRARHRLQHDTGLYKGSVQQLRELKPEIESLQQQLHTSQQAMQRDFEVWRAAALVKAREGSSAPTGRSLAGGTTGKCRDCTSHSRAYGGA
jgi:hypothetical protein